MPLPKTNPNGNKARQAKVTTPTEVVIAARETDVTPKLAQVPPMSIADGYIQRNVAVNLTDFDVFDMAINRARNILIKGPTGSGKTSGVMAWAAKTGRRFYSVATNAGLDPTQLFGRMMPDGKGGWIWIDGGVTDIARHGGVLLINEVNFLPPKIATVLFGLLDFRRSLTLMDHRGEVIQTHRPDCWCDLDEKECRERWVLIAADLNPGYSGTRELNAAFANRFAYQMEWDYDPNIERTLIKSDVLLKMANDMRQQVAAGKLETPIATNMLIEFVEMVNDLGFDFAVTSFVQHFMADERPSVTTVFNTYRKQLEEDLDDSEADKVFTQIEDDDSGWMDAFADEMFKDMD